MTSTSGRRVVVPLTNKSGGGVIAGDVVIVDTGNNDAFTTTTSGAVSSKVIGVAQETIANNATGRVCTYGYAALINVNASVTRGNFGATHTVAKQATDAGASRVTGTFCQFLTGGTTPDGFIFGMPDGGSGTGAPTTAKYVTTESDGTLSAEKVRSDLKSYSPDNKGTTNAVSNEFDGTSGGTYTWTTTPGSSDENSTFGGHLYVLANTNQAAAYYYYRASYAPGATNFSVAAKFEPAMTRANATYQIGLALLDSSDVAIWRNLVLDNGSTGSTTIYRYNDTNAGTLTTGIGFGAPIYLLIQRTSGNVYTGYWSANGKTWVTGGSSTVATTVAKVSIAVLSSTTTDKPAAIDFLRVFDSITTIVGA